MDFSQEELELLAAILVDGQNKETQFAALPIHQRVALKIGHELKKMNTTNEQ